jgi:prepilin-type N-terminal cleavage/methylation domain-containing protein
MSLFPILLVRKPVMPHLSRFSSRLSKAFTLSELLISLAILGLIAAFVVPMVMHSIGEAAIQSNLREAIIALDQVANEAYMQGKYAEKRFQWFQQNLNTTQVCVNDTSCMGGEDVGSSQNYSLVLPSGAVVTNIHPLSTFSHGDVYIVDGNDPKGSNIDGQDRILLNSPTFNAQSSRQAPGPWHTACLTALPNWPSNRTGWLCPHSVESGVLYRKALGLETP